MSYIEVMNKYYELLLDISKEFRSSSYELETKYGITGISVKMSELKKNPERKLTQKSIRDIEKALNITINDSDPENITYTKNKPEQEVPFEGVIQVYNYPILNNVYVGDPGMLKNESNETGVFAYKKGEGECFGLRVNGSSMKTALNNGDIVLVDMGLKPINGDLVVVKLKNGEQFIKKFYQLNDGFIKLSSDNPDNDVELIREVDIQVIYSVVQIVLNVKNR